LIAITILLVNGPNARPEISSVPVTVAVIVTVGWLAAPAAIVTSKSMYPAPLIVFEADVFAEMPVAPPNDKGAVTVSALANVAGLFNATRTTNVVPATYVPFPLNAVKLVIASAACALIATTALLASGPSARPEISSAPLTVAVIVTEGWLGAPTVTVIKKSMYPAPLIVFDADAFAERPDAPPKFNDAVTASAFADVAGLFNETRMTNVVPATNVPLPALHVKLVIVKLACALMLTFNAVLGPALNARPEYSSLPDAVAVIESDCVAVPAAIVIRKSMYPAPLIVFDADPFAVTPSTSPANAAVTESAFADVAGLFNATRITNVVPATKVPLPDK